MKMATIVDHDALRKMREFNSTHPGTQWFAYENVDLGHSMLGHVQFLAVGPECTHKNAPKNFPDTSWGLGWRYSPIGVVNVGRGTVGDET